MNKTTIDLTKRSNTIVDQLIETITNQIISGKRKPGERLSELKLAREFGISRAPIREALIALEEQSLVRKTYRSREVVQISKKDIKELFEVKIAIEGYAAMCVAETATEADKKKLKYIIEKMKKNLDPLNFKDYQKASRSFHDTIIHLTRNNKLKETYDSVVRQIRWAASLSLQMPHRAELTLEEHAAIYNAILNLADARKIMEDHSTRSMERTLKRLTEID